MRFRKRPKAVEAVTVSDILSARRYPDRLPDWVKQAMKAGKVQVYPQSVMVIIGRQVKSVFSEDWLAYDMEQEQVYCISKRTMETDYERVQEGMIRGHGHG